MKSETPNLDYLRDQVMRLKFLLDDPHPGLISWCMAYAEQMQAIGEFYYLDSVRKTVADYMQSEGCGCCEGNRHEEDNKRLAELLKVGKHSDGSGYNFNKYATKPIE